MEVSQGYVGIGPVVPVLQHGGESGICRDGYQCCSMEVSQGSVGMGTSAVAWR